MVNKKFCLGILLMVLVFGMTIVGCKDDDVQIIAFEYAESPSEVSILTGLSEDGTVGSVIVTWNSVKNALSYDVYGQTEPIDIYGKNRVPDIKYFSTIPAYGFGGVLVMRPTPTPGVITTEITEMRADIDISEVQLGRQGIKWRFGVTVTDIDKNHVPSKIVWSEYVTIP